MEELRVLVVSSVSSDKEITVTARTEKLNQFIDIVKLCNLNISISTNIPDYASSHGYDLVFVDLQDYPSNDISFNYLLKLASSLKICLFNAPKDSIDEQKALLVGIGGVFYESDRADIILKGITGLKNDEYWFKRATINSALNELLKDTSSFGTQKNESATIDLGSLLTKRERTIISFVSKGAQNKEIADQLHISVNTVKTHIYSLFRKTSSRNRIELAAWSQQYHQSRILN